MDTSLFSPFSSIKVSAYRKISIGINVLYKGTDQLNLSAKLKIETGIQLAFLTTLSTYGWRSSRSICSQYKVDLHFMIVCSKCFRYIENRIRRSHRYTFKPGDISSNSHSCPCDNLKKKKKNKPMWYPQCYFQNSRP